MKDFIKYSSIGFTIVAIFLIAYLIGNKTNHLALALIIGALFNVMFILSIIRKEIK